MAPPVAPCHLHQDVALREQLDGLERAALGAQQALPALHKLSLVANQAADLDDVTLHVVLEHSQRLRAATRYMCM